MSLLKSFVLVTGIASLGLTIYLIHRWHNPNITYTRRNANSLEIPQILNSPLPNSNDKDDFSNRLKDVPLLIMFTSFKEDRNHTHHEFAHSLAIENWSSFIPFVIPVLFTETINSPLAMMAKKHHWEILHLKRVSPSGAPFLKDMYQTVFEKYNSTFYGFANGDLLFDDSLIETLRSIKGRLVSLKNNVLITGVRTNVEISSYLQSDKVEFSKNNLQNVSKTKGRLYQVWAEDYFIFTKTGSSLKWDDIADVVIGRIAYGNYLVAISNRYLVNTIDATNTLLALHLSKKGVAHTGRQNPDNDYNLKAIGSFEFGAGKTTATQFQMVSDDSHRPIMLKRG